MCLWQFETALLISLLTVLDEVSIGLSTENCSPSQGRSFFISFVFYSFLGAAVSTILRKSWYHKQCSQRSVGGPVKTGTVWVKSSSVRGHFGQESDQSNISSDRFRLSLDWSWTRL
jgi:hypothetical protein